MNPFELRLSTRFEYIQRREREVRVQLLTQTAEVDHAIHLARTFRSPHDPVPDCVRAEWDTLYADGEALCRSTPILEPLRVPRKPCTGALHSLLMEVPQQHHGSLLCFLVHNEAMPGRITLLDVGRVHERLIIGGNSFLRMFNRASGKCLADWVTTVPSSSNCVLSAAYVDHRWLVFGSEDGFVRFFDTRLSAIVEEFPAHGAPVTFVDAVSIAGACLVSASDDGCVRLWRERTLEPAAQIAIPPDRIRSCGIRTVKGHASLVLATEGMRAYAWSPATQAVLNVEPDALGPHPYYGFAVIRQERSVTVQSVNNEVVSLTLGGRPVDCVDAHEDLVAIAADDRFAMWRVTTSGDQRRDFPPEM
jgi:hypothetical protein